MPSSLLGSEPLSRPAFLDDESWFTHTKLPIAVFGHLRVEYRVRRGTARPGSARPTTAGPRTARPRTVWNDSLGGTAGDRNCHHRGRYLGGQHHMKANEDRGRRDRT